VRWRTRYRELVTAFAAIVTHAARLLAAHWPALLAWMLAGTLGHYLVLKLASLVGARSAVGGILLLPLAALAMLIAYVAMFLVLRDGMPQLRRLAPLPESRAERRTAFLDALLGGILPFVAFYAAWGYIREDVIDYINGAFEWQFFWGIEAAVNGVEYDTSGTIDDLGVDAITLTILVLAFAGRWAHKRYRARLPKWTGAVAVYLEVLWVYLAVYIVADLLGVVTDWVQTRQATVWLGDLRSSLTGVFAPLGVVWDGIEWLLGEAGGIILLPVAWLAIAGVIYGQAVKAEAPRLSGDIVERVRTRYNSVPERVRRRVGDVWQDLTGRFRPIGRAIVLMWRAGPLLICGYILLYTLVDFGGQWLMIGLSRAVGPHPQSFWLPMSVALVLVVGLIVEPVRISLVAASYDRALVHLAPEPSTPGLGPRAEASLLDGEPQVEHRPGGLVEGRDGDDEGTDDVVGEQHRRDDVVRDDGV